MRTDPLLQTQPDIDRFQELELTYPKFGEYIPYFFNKNRVSIPLEGTYQNESLFIFASGPSVKDLDYKYLKNVPILAINNAAIYLLLNGIIPTFFNANDDPSHFVKQIWLNPLIQKFIPFDRFNQKLWDNEEWKPLNKTVQDCVNVIGYFRNEKFFKGRWFKEKTINWGLHQSIGDCRSTLLSSIKIAFLLGFRKVFLLGVDFEMTKDKSYVFNERRTDFDINSNNRNYKKMSDEMLLPIKEEGEKLGFYIFNCNEKSKLKVFPYINYKEAIDKTSKIYYTLDKIESAGMYISYDVKNKNTREKCISMTEKGK